MGHSKLAWGLGLGLIAGLAIAGCSSDTTLPDVDCKGTVPKYSELTAFKTVCTSCHSSEVMGDARRDATVGLDFNTYEGAKANAMKIAGEINEGAMPPAGSGLTLEKVDQTATLKWAMCDTPN